MSLPHPDRKWSSKHPLKRRQVLLDTPDFNLTILRCVDLQGHVARIDHTQACALDVASMATVQMLGQAEQSTQDGHNLLGTLIQRREFRTFFARQRLAMI